MISGIYYYDLLCINLFKYKKYKIAVSFADIINNVKKNILHLQKKYQKIFI